MFFKKEEAKKVETGKYQNALTITFKDGSSLRNSINTKKDGIIIPPWKEFYKWYFTREQSPSFMVKYTGGERLVVRKDIKYFGVAIERVN